MAFESFNKERPEETQEVENQEQENTEQATTEETTVDETKGGQSTESTETTETTEQTTETTESTETAPDEFIETFNKRYNTKYKADDDIKGLFTLPRKVTEYEEKLKDHDSLKDSVEKYKKELEDVKDTHMSYLLSKPRIRSAYISE